MNPSPILTLVDRQDFRRLFINELGWRNPDQPPLTVTIEDGTRYTLTPIASYKGMRIWHCPVRPSRTIQRQIDQLVGATNLERLIIFTDPHRQDWRWPRRAQLGGVSSKLLVHPHTVGEYNQDLDRRLRSIEIDFEDDITLVALLQRMRAAFDTEAETASVQAARLMGTLYTELEAARYREQDATLLLARLLFVLFADDTNVWERKTNLFTSYIETHTTPDNLHEQLSELFTVLNTPEKNRNLPADSPLAVFDYVNGGLFAAPLDLKPLTPGFREHLLDAGLFDWAVISPAIFGSMFQTVKLKEARRAGGEHYTTEENILKVIEPLFLTELRQRLQSAWNDKGQLTKLHNDLGALRFLDPACGCGNFLIVTYRELRALELDLLKRRRDLDLADGVISGKNLAQTVLDVTEHVKVTVDHFAGIEIEEWPARIAETAMLLVDYIANQNMEEEFGSTPPWLPITTGPNIIHDNALRVDWATAFPPSDNVIVFGNPPFIGQYTKTAQQTADTRRVWGPRYNGYLDYVTCWYAKALDYYKTKAGRWAFVSTNSICQGEAVEYLWRPILDAGWRCRFAHRSFRWFTEAPGGAAVHVSILGFDKHAAPKPVLWKYPEGGQGTGTPRTVTRINPYLLPDAPIVLVSSRTNPTSSSLPPVTKGNQPTDGGHFFVSSTDLPAVKADPIASKYLRRFVGARELLHDKERWCLWMVGASQQDLNASQILRERVAAVRRTRLDSPKAATRAKAATAHLFDERRQPDSSYLAIPSHVGEHRRYFTAARYENDVICGNANFMVADPDGFVLGVLSSSMFIAWMRAIGGRLESRLRFSNTFTYNTFPLPPLSPKQKQAVIGAARGIITAREAYPTLSLAEMYDSGTMPTDLLAAHTAVDRVVDSIFDFRGEVTEEDRQRLLFRRYAKLTGIELLDI